MKKALNLVCINSCALFALCVFFPVSTQAYFEHQYFCAVEGNSIIVTLQTGERSCFSYLHDFSINIQRLNEQREVALNYIEEGEDVAYWNSVADQLREKKQDVVDFQEQFLVAIDDYEANLFLRIKGILNYYFRQTRIDLMASIDQTRQLLLYTKLAGDSEKYAELLTKLASYLERMQLLDAIRFSQQFDQLIPPLKSYLHLLEERPLSSS